MIEKADPAGDTQHIFFQQVGAEIYRLLAAGLEHILAFDIEQAAEIFNVGMKKTAFGIFAQQQHRHFFARRVEAVFGLF